MAPRSLRKTFLGHTTDWGIFQKSLYSKERRKYLYHEIFEEKGEGNPFPYFQQGELSLLFLMLCVSLQNEDISTI